MSTIRTLLLVTVSAAAVGMAVATSNPQMGTGPGKLTGPGAISTSTTARLSPNKDGSYTYTVTLTDKSAFDQSINVYDASGSLLPESPIVVPAGQLSQDFQVSAIYPGDDTLTASNGFSAASMDVTVY